jgi:hypothetical protein
VHARSFGLLRFNRQSPHYRSVGLWSSLSLNWPLILAHIETNPSSGQVAGPMLAHRLRCRASLAGSCYQPSLGKMSASTANFLAAQAIPAPVLPHGEF